MAACVFYAAVIDNVVAYCVHSWTELSQNYDLLHHKHALK